MCMKYSFLDNQNSGSGPYYISLEHWFLILKNDFKMVLKTINSLIYHEVKIFSLLKKNCTLPVFTIIDKILINSLADKVI